MQPTSSFDVSHPDQVDPVIAPPKRTPDSDPDSPESQDQNEVQHPLTQSGKVRESISQIAIPILVIHLLGACALFPVFWSTSNLVLLFISAVCFGQGINLGYHRILAHRSLSVPKWLEHFYVMLALCSLEESPGKWVSTHRRHHRFSDSEPDPHSPSESFFWSHLGWLLRSRNGKQEFKHDDSYTVDLMKDRFYVALEKHPLLPGLIYVGHGILFFAVAFLIGYLVEVENPAWTAVGVVLWGVFLRTVLVWHITWSVNSICHRFGYQNYQTGEKSRNNWIVALMSSGEGWHNNHHHDPSSACNQHRWWELDLTWVHIRLLELTGLGKKVNRPRRSVMKQSDQ